MGLGLLFLFQLCFDFIDGAVPAASSPSWIIIFLWNQNKFCLKKLTKSQWSYLLYYEISSSQNKVPKKATQYRELCLVFTHYFLKNLKGKRNSKSKLGEIQPPQHSENILWLSRRFAIALIKIILKWCTL